MSLAKIKEERERKMYGTTEAEVRGLLARLGTGPGAYRPDPAMMIVSILSDAQEAAAMGDVELSRQFINRAKLLVMEVLR